MEKVLPSIVHETDSQENLLGIAYDNIIAILLEGVKSLSNEVEELKNKIINYFYLFSETLEVSNLY